MKKFHDQLASADIIVANKTDRATARSDAALQQWWRQYGGDRPAIHAEHGQMNGKRFWIYRDEIWRTASQRHAFSHSCQ